MTSRLSSPIVNRKLPETVIRQQFVAANSALGTTTSRLSRKGLPGLVTAWPLDVEDFLQQSGQLEDDLMSQEPAEASGGGKQQHFLG